jgi:hypothetical protein
MKNCLETPLRAVRGWCLPLLCDLDCDPLELDDSTVHLLADWGGNIGRVDLGVY